MKHATPAVPFPQPRQLGANATRWKLSELLAFEAARDNREPPTVTADAERWLTSNEVCHRLGIGRTTLWRWARESAEVAA